ncbi:MAG: hypothetical protein ACTSRG_03095 [Candidatus Helarchaeota archaeon]
MSFLEKFDDWPSPEKTKLLLIVSLILAIGSYLVMGLIFLQAGGSMDIMGSQLSFSGFKMKMQYFPMVMTGGIDSYRIAQILDYIFMVGYGSLIFSLALSIGRNFDSISVWRKMGYILAILGIIAACLDGFENLFILFTLTNPLGFPDWWTVAHSCFALTKWIIIFTAIIWAIIAAIKLKL